LPVITIPPNRPCIRQQWPDRFFRTEMEKWRAIVDEVERLHATGRPLLIGTRSVHASERLGQLLAERGLAARILNATRLKEEAQIIATAGEKGRVTIATNMAGRGTDIKLDHEIVSLGGLHVIASERHESGRVDRQLFGRSGRQGDAGSAQAFVSLEDELIQRHLPGSMERILQQAWKRNSPGKTLLIKSSLRVAQSKAQAMGRRQRESVLRADLWLDTALSFAGGDLV